MKTIVVVVMCCVAMMACSLNAKNAKRPVGYRLCSSDASCFDGEYCGFVEVDSVAVCRTSPQEYNWGSR
jgi:hypothetical protein